MDYKFYDTSSLLLKADNLFSNELDEIVVISSITIQELENIKTSNNKDQDVKYAARHLLKELENFNYELVLFNQNMLNLINGTDFEVTNDIKILVSALYYKEQHPDKELFFVTNDIILKKIAELFFDKSYICSIDEDKVDDYEGYLDISLSPEEMSDLYQYPDKNKFNLLINQYIIVRDQITNEIVDALCWNGETHRKLKYHELNSHLFGKIKPIKNDIYQALAIDSLLNNQITMLKGKAGSGKSTLSIAYLFDQLERGKIDKIIIFCNPVATRNSARLGLIMG